MINKKDFFRILNEYDSIFKKNGFVKEKNGLYSRPGFNIVVELNKWGWDDKSGWGFFVRAIDMRYKDEYGIFDWNGVLELTPKTINLAKATTENAYSSQPTGVREIFQEGQWISFYDTEHLRTVLDCTLPPMLKMITKWISQQEKRDFAEKRKVEKLSRDKKSAIQQEAGRAFDD